MITMNSEKELNILEEKDISSLMLFALYKMQEVPEYSTLSEFAYILDTQSLVKFLEFFGGTTIKVPTLYEYKTMLNALLLYEYINLQNIEYTKAVTKLDCKEFEFKDIKKAYRSLCDTLSKYDFSKGDE